MQPLRIYVCGAHSTGKTTLARHLANELGLPLINEVARQVMAEMEITFETLRVDLDRVAAYQREVFRRQVEVEERYPEGFVSDRAFCNLAYAARHSRALADLLDSELAKRYFEHLRRNGLVFFVRPHRECMQDDGFRERVEWDEINRIDGMLDFVFGWQRIGCIGISELNMKDRVRTALTAVRLYQRSLHPLAVAATPHQQVSAPAAKPSLGAVAQAAAQAAAQTTVQPDTRRMTAKKGNGNGKKGNGNGHGEQDPVPAGEGERAPLHALWSDLASY